MHSAADRQDTRGRAGDALSAALWALFASAMLVESDIYRYVALAFAIFALVRHGREVRQVSRDWLALACYAWAAYALLRFGFGIVLSGQKGTSEWLYAFPALFPLVGVALYTTRRSVFAAGAVLLACGLTGLLVTLDFHAVFAGERAAPLFHHNPIHAGVGGSMLFLTAVFWLLHAAETGRLAGRLKWPCLALGLSTAVLSLVGVLGAQSKGAWLALAATMGFMGLLSLYHLAGRWRLHLLGGLVVLAIAVAAIAAPYVVKVAGSTADAAGTLLERAFATKDPLGAIQATIGDETVPSAMRERLMLWSNALELIQKSPFVGWGNAWLDEWKRTAYADVGYTLLHNGYLEILVRHGLVGLAFLLIFAVSAARRVNAARREGRIGSSAAAYLFSMSFFFFATITTNSNNRLALGESFFLLAGGAVFAIALLRRETPPATHTGR